MRPRLRWVSALVAGLTVQLFFGITSTPFLLLLGSMFLIALFLFANRAESGFRMALVGVVLNMGVIAANAGMPVSAPAALTASPHKSLSVSDLRHVKLEDGTPLALLGDQFPVGGRVLSIGDVSIAVGLFIYLLSITKVAIGDHSAVAPKVAP